MIALITQLYTFKNQIKDNNSFCHQRPVSRVELKRHLICFFAPGQREVVNCAEQHNLLINKTECSTLLCSTWNLKQYLSFCIISINRSPPLIGWYLPHVIAEAEWQSWEIIPWTSDKSNWMAWKNKSVKSVKWRLNACMFVCPSTLDSASTSTSEVSLNCWMFVSN